MQNHTRIWRAAEPNPAKRYLMEYRALVQRRDALADELDRMREATRRATGRLSGMPLSAGPERREDSLLRVVDCEARLCELLSQIAAVLSARLLLIETLPDERQKTVLTLRYINGMGWETIGHTMHYERTQIFDIHLKGLAEVRRAMEGLPSLREGSA